MARKKKSANSEAARRAAFRKRKKGVLKKAGELSTLCGVQACAIIYGPREAVPEVWPSVEAATVALERFRSMPEMEQTKKMMNWERFYGDRIAKAENQIARVERENNEARCAALVFRCMADPRLVGELDPAAVSSLLWTVESKLHGVWDRIRTLEEQDHHPVDPPPPPVPVVADMLDGRGVHIDKRSDGLDTELQTMGNARPPSPDVFAGVMEEPGVLDGGTRAAQRHGVFNDYNPQLFWPVEDPTAGFASMFGDGGGYALRQPDEGGASSSNANAGDVNNPNGVEFSDQSWMD